MFFPIVFYLWLVKVTDRIDRQDLFFFVIMELIAISSFLTGNYFVICIFVAVIFAALSHWIYKAAELKEEADLTI